ncbi:DUF1573 domain-containing protein [Fimbriiglobus ruber]|uniref:DUF1573 domain-containing protein n=1 Tax=Fimbriiglobus ruber TaxID=1908690 RepID=A0A225EH28_9BACT|nr:DUF1573 domain-containing protein [Fimbriiglobus ruber]OWK47497.1 hypothetical protein FRUB_01196 [Fimbriiglobus ruber]
MHRVLLAGLVVFASVGGARAGAEQYFSETSKDFGTTPRGPILIHYFTVKNTSQQTLNLGPARVSCGCVTPTVMKSQLAPGETTAVVAHMDSRRIPQANVLKTVIVYVPVQNSGTGIFEEVQLRVSAIARDDLVMSPETFAFGTVRKGQGGKSTTKITFYSDPNWKISDVMSTGVYVKAEAKPVAHQGSEAVYEITATLDPKCPVGNWTADIWLKSTAPGIERLRIPVTVNVVAPIVANPEAVKFGDVKVGETADQKVILQGNQAFKILKIKGAKDDLEVKAVGEGSRPVHILKLALKASESGDVTESIEVETDHPDQPTVVIPVTAKAAK